MELAAWRMPENGPHGLQAHFDAAVASLPVPVKYKHDRDSRKSVVGFPDCLVIGRGGALLAELKRQAEDPTPAQQEWLDMAAASGAFRIVAVYRPLDWYSARVTGDLALIAGLRVLAESGDEVTM